MIRALVVDDEAPARARLRAMLADVGGVTVVGEADDADSARAAVARLAPDVVFLDIEMPAERGTDLAASLPHPRPLIVFATAYERFAVDAFQYDAADYLLKPVNRQRLHATLTRIAAKLARRQDQERESTAASQAQARLLPQHLPEIAGYGLGARTRAARAVSGDFYDAAQVEGAVAFVLGDVSGKGMAAGLIASSVQARWQAAIRQRDLTLSGMMTTLNADVYRSTEGSKYATLVHGVLIPPTGVLHYVNAGHPPALLVNAAGTWTPALAATAPAVGLFDGASFASSSCTLAPGDTLIVVSDGVSEALDASGCELDLEVIAALARQHGELDPQHLAAAVVEAVCRHRGLDQGQDDVTVFTLRRRA